jgi:hypothetical protein
MKGPQALFDFMRAAGIAAIAPTELGGYDVSDTGAVRRELEDTERQRRPFVVLIRPEKTQMRRRPKFNRGTPETRA